MSVPNLRNLYLPYLEQRPDAAMLIEHGQAISYRDFDAAVGRTAAWLAAQGVGAGDKVGVWLARMAVPAVRR